MQHGFSMATSPRPPPRFVPTLTDVVRVPPAADKTPPSAPVPPPKPPLAPAAGLAVSAPRPAVASTARALPAVKSHRPADPAELEDQLVRRVMERVDAVLDQRVREATAKVVMEQTRALGPALRREIEQTVRLTVAQALLADLGGTDTQPAPGP